MNIRYMATAALLASSTAAFAGGIDRSGQDSSVIFEDGTYLQFSFGSVNPTISGTHPLAGPSGDMAPTYTQFSLGYKQALSDRFDLALTFDQPFGANVDYPAGTTYPLAGTVAELNSSAITLLGRYRVSDRFSVLAGVRHQSINGDIAITGGYTLTAEDPSGFGFVAGAAYEIPDIALRVAAIYNSGIDHTMEGTEVGFPSSFDTRTPQSVNLNFQSGVAKDTLVFGSVRWVDWSSFDITPNFYPGGALVSYSNDSVTYNLGVGRRFTENFSGSVSLGYEKAQGGTVSNLGPTDGYFSVQVGGRYTMDNVTVSGGVRWVNVGDATTDAPISASFTDNKAIGVGMSVGVSF